EHVLAHHRAVLVGAVVVAGDGARADVGARTDLGIAQVAQVTGLGALAEHRVLQLDEVADVGLFAQHGARAQAGERTTVGALADLRAFQVRIGLDDGAGAKHGILDHAVRADLHVVLDDDLAFEDHVDVDQHVATHTGLAAQVETRRIDQRHALGHQPARGTALVVALQLGELDAVVGAQYFHLVGGLYGGDAQAVGHGHGDHVGQVVLALGVAVGQPPQPVAQAVARYGEDAGVAFRSEERRVGKDGRGRLS